MARKKSKKSSENKLRPAEGTEAVIRAADFPERKPQLQESEDKPPVVEKSWEEFKDKSSEPLEKALDKATGVHGKLTQMDVLSGAESSPSRQFERWVAVPLAAVVFAALFALWQRQR